MFRNYLLSECITSGGVGSFDSRKWLWELANMPRLFVGHCPLCTALSKSLSSVAVLSAASKSDL